MMLLQFTPHGIYCEKGGFYIDPWKPCKRALITHAHADHARWGHSHYLAHTDSAPILRLRLGTDISLETVNYGEKKYFNGVEVTFFPAGHIPGSAQIRVSHKGETWVVSGDYKTEADGICTPFEPVKCQHFVTESTFGLPIYRWKPQLEVYAEINKWWEKNASEDKCSVLFGYALGKAQRLMSGLDTKIGPIFTHGAVHNVNEAFGGIINLPTAEKVTQSHKKADFRKAMVVAPPSAIGTPWIKKMQPYATGMASGWMSVRGMKRRRAMDQGFVLSDHADWQGLLQAIAATGAENIYVTHGYTDLFSRYLNELGYHAQTVETLFVGEEGDDNAEPQAAKQQE